LQFMCIWFKHSQAFNTLSIMLCETPIVSIYI
jgi:hypothetical protein